MTEISEKTEKLIDDEDDVDNQPVVHPDQDMAISSDEKILFKPEEVHKAKTDLHFNKE